MAALEGKSAWRARLLASRAEVPASTRAAEARALAAWLRDPRGLGVPDGPGLPGVSGATVCAYYPVGSEPGSALMLDALVTAGFRVLLPVVAGAGPLEWVEYGGCGGSSGLAGGPYGLVEPVGPRLGAAALSLAVLVLVPALAVDRRGVRLGRGGGYYDRSLPLAAPGAALVAVVRDAELVPRLPAEPHDVPMTAALTPTAGLTPLPH